MALEHRPEFLRTTARDRRVVPRNVSPSTPSTSPTRPRWRPATIVRIGEMAPLLSLCLGRTRSPFQAVKTGAYHWVGKSDEVLADDSPRRTPSVNGYSAAYAGSAWTS